jgi:hypothetical protein
VLTAVSQHCSQHSRSALQYGRLLRLIVTKLQQVASSKESYLKQFKATHIMLVAHPKQSKTGGKLMRCGPLPSPHAPRTLPAATAAPE